jgi:hypothetical protein
MANPLPTAISFFPDTQAGRGLRRQSLEIDRFLCGNQVGDHNVVAVDGRLKIAERYLADVWFLISDISPARSRAPSG